MFTLHVKDYLATHFRSIDDSSKSHIQQFAAFLHERLGAAADAAVADETDPLERAALSLLGAGYTVYHPDNPPPAAPPAIEAAIAALQQAGFIVTMPRFERRLYADGTKAAGVAPLPDHSPTGAATVTCEDCTLADVTGVPIAGAGPAARPSGEPPAYTPPSQAKPVA